MNTAPSPALVCQHARVAGDACLDCGAWVPMPCPCCGAELHRPPMEAPGFCATCGAPTPWFLQEFSGW